MVDLRPTDRETDLAAQAAAAFGAGEQPPSAATFTEACIVAAAAGRTAPDRTYLLQQWAALLGWPPDSDDPIALTGSGSDDPIALTGHGDDGSPPRRRRPSGRVTVSFGVDGDRCRHVARAAAAGVLLVADREIVADIDLADTVRTPMPTLFDPDACHVDLPRGWRSRARPYDVGWARTGAIVLLAADCAGAAAAALDATVDRVTQRPMRGGMLGDLQVVRHRLADMAIAVTACWDAVLDAAAHIDRANDGMANQAGAGGPSTASPRPGTLPDAAAHIDRVGSGDDLDHHAGTGTEHAQPADDVRLAAIRAKAVTVDRGRRVAADAVRLAGGIGILDDHPWQRWYRRVKAAEPLFGSPRDHRAEIARASLARFR